MNVENFENRRWLNFDQSNEFRHRMALEVVSNGPVIDLGCGDGFFLGQLRKKNISGLGLDISSEAITKCEAAGLKVMKFDLASGNLPFGDDSFEYVTILDNLEHDFDPAIILKEAARIGKNIIIAVPNFNSLPSRIQALIGEVPENNRHNKGHVYWFNYYVLCRLLEKCGLSISEIKMNIFRQKMLGKHFSKFLLWLSPNLFALSFVVRVNKKP